MNFIMNKQNILEKKYNFLRPIKTDNLIRLGREMDGGYIVDYNIINKYPKNLFYVRNKHNHKF